MVWKQGEPYHGPQGVCVLAGFTRIRGTLPDFRNMRGLGESCLECTYFKAIHKWCHVLDLSPAEARLQHRAGFETCYLSRSRSQPQAQTIISHTETLWRCDLRALHNSPWFSTADSWHTTGFWCWDRLQGHKPDFAIRLLCWEGSGFL